MTEALLRAFASKDWRAEPALVASFFLKISLYVLAMKRLVAFLILLHSEISSALTFVLFQSTSRCTGELFSSLSRIVLR